MSTSGNHCECGILTWGDLSIRCVDEHDGYKVLLLCGSCYVKKARCSNCLYFERDPLDLKGSNDYDSFCCFNPKRIRKSAQDRCGRWRQKDLIFLLKPPKKVKKKDG